jgi:hypothetical protein
MNKRIKQLATEVGISVEYLNNTKQWPLIEALAERIVEECIGCCEQVISDPVPESVDTFEQGGIHCIDEIRQHFGIGMSTEDKKILIKELLGVKNERSD